MDEIGSEIAALAMVTDLRFEEIRAVLPPIEQKTIPPEWIDDFLARRGVAVMRRTHGVSEDEAWPPEPWCDMHLCLVRVAPKSSRDHMVVLMGDGSVIDPLSMKLHAIDDYDKVISVAGLVSQFRFV